MRSNEMIAAMLTDASTNWDLARWLTESIQSFLGRCFRDDFDHGLEGCKFPELYTRVTGEQIDNDRERHR